MAKKTPDQMAKEWGNKDYHSEKVLSGDPNKDDYNVAVSGRKGGESYSKSLIKSKKGKKLQRTTTRTIKTPGGKSSTSSYVKQNKVKGGHQISGKIQSKKKRKVGLLEKRGL